MNLSVIIITKNEQDTISECIMNLSFADEILVIDNNSSDQTADIAKKLDARVYVVRGLDFSYLRNFGKEKAHGNWLFYIDADERVTKELAFQIKNMVTKESKYSGFHIIRKNYFLGTLWLKPEKMLRLIKKDDFIGWQGSLHETPLIAGSVGQLSGDLLHFTHTSLTQMIHKTNKWSDVEARLRFKSNHPKMVWWRFFRVMITTFWRYFIIQSGWKMGTAGFIESMYQAFSIFITYAKLWELQNKSILKPHEK